MYRIGQTKPVKVFQLIAEDTVEDKVLEIQKRKDALISSAFSGNKAVVKDKERIGECFGRGAVVLTRGAGAMGQVTDLFGGVVMWRRVAAGGLE